MTSGYIEFSAVPAEPREENAGIITALLGDYPFTTFDFDGETVKAWAEEDTITGADLQAASEAVEAFCCDPCSSVRIEKQNWNEAWEKEFFDPVTVDDRVHIRASFHPAGPDVEFVLTITPRMSFGTGHHATTRLMAKHLLDQRDRFAGARVLDMGSGTGVLGILAEKLGATEVVAIDNESWAAENATENAAANGCKHFRSVHGDAAALRAIEPAHFDVVLANIHLNILLADATAYLRVLRPGGLILFSGFYTTDFPMFRANMEKLGCSFAAVHEADGWCAAAFIK